MKFLFFLKSIFAVYNNYFEKKPKKFDYWHLFILFYSVIYNDRKQKDEEYKKEQYVGEELDWKMHADNLYLFGIQIEDLKDLKGIDDYIED